MDKYEVARIFDEIAFFLALTGENPFKSRAYHKAAHTLENLEEDLESLVKENRLTELPAIGEHIAKKIATLMTVGHLDYYEKLKSKVPQGLLELLHVPGLGIKKIRILYDQLNIQSVDELTEACCQGKIEKIRGFGKVTQKNILNALNKLKTFGLRFLLPSAMKIAKPILEGLAKLKETQKVEIAGSIRRKLETVGDLDFLVASDYPEAIMDWFTKHLWVEKILAKGLTKTSVLLKQRIQADLRVVPKRQFAFALLYFTGSKEHNIKLRRIANDLGFSLSEYGLEAMESKQDPLFAISKVLTESNIYEALGLVYIPPELRENRGEIEVAQKGKLPRLIESKDIRGVFHCHTVESDGHNTLEEMVRGAQDLGWEYIGIADHSKSSFLVNGLNEERLFAQIKQIRDLNQSGHYSIHAFAGLECDILTDGRLDFPNEVLKELDFVVISVHRTFKLSEEEMTKRLIKAIENPYTSIVGHLTGRLLLKREGYSINLPKIIDACIANGKVMELNAQPNRLDMDWRHWHKAAEKGLKCSINPDAHSISDLLYYRIGVDMARKGWLRKSDVINTFSLKKVQKYLRH